MRPSQGESGGEVLAGDVRQRMVLSALYLIAERGVQGTSIADVLERSGAPRGSVYHHFPGGKDEIVGAAMEYMATDARVPLRALRGSDVAGIVTGFINLWRGVLTKSEFAAGCATAGVTVSGESETARAAARKVFEVWIADLTELLEAAGVDPSKAADFAWMLFASTEGALVFARAEHSMRALDLVEQQLLASARLWSDRAGRPRRRGRVNRSNSAETFASCVFQPSLCGRDGRAGGPDLAGGCRAGPQPQP